MSALSDPEGGDVAAAFAKLNPSVAELVAFLGAANSVAQHPYVHAMNDGSMSGAVLCRLITGALDAGWATTADPRRAVLVRACIDFAGYHAPAAAGRRHIQAQPEPSQATVPVSAPTPTATPAPAPAPTAAGAATAAVTFSTPRKVTAEPYAVSPSSRGPIASASADTWLDPFQHDFDPMSDGGWVAFDDLKSPSAEDRKWVELQARLTPAEIKAFSNRVVVIDFRALTDPKIPVCVGVRAEFVKSGGKFQSYNNFTVMNHCGKFVTGGESHAVRALRESSVSARLPAESSSSVLRNILVRSQESAFYVLPPTLRDTGASITLLAGRDLEKLGLQSENSMAKRASLNGVQCQRWQVRFEYLNKGMFLEVARASDVFPSDPVESGLIGRDFLQNFVALDDPRNQRTVMCRYTPTREDDRKKVSQIPIHKQPPQPTIGFAYDIDGGAITDVATHAPGAHPVLLDTKIDDLMLEKAKFLARGASPDEYAVMLHPVLETILYPKQVAGEVVGLPEPPLIAIVAGYATESAVNHPTAQPEAAVATPPNPAPQLPIASALAETHST